MTSPLESLIFDWCGTDEPVKALADKIQSQAAARNDVVLEPPRGGNQRGSSLGGRRGLGGPPVHTCPNCGGAQPTRGWCRDCLIEEDHGPDGSRPEGVLW